jgi:hypothetical protein
MVKQLRAEGTQEGVGRPWHFHSRFDPECEWSAHGSGGTPPQSGSQPRGSSPAHSGPNVSRFLLATKCDLLMRAARVTLAANLDEAVERVLALLSENDD